MINNLLISHIFQLVMIKKVSSDEGTITIEASITSKNRKRKYNRDEQIVFKTIF